MTDIDKLNIAIAVLTDQRNAALSGCVQLQIDLACAQEEIKRLNAELLTNSVKE